jgi:hypothetical protein
MNSACHKHQTRNKYIFALLRNPYTQHYFHSEFYDRRILLKSFH